MKKRRKLQSKILTRFKNKAWIIAGIAVISLTLVGLFGRKLVELDRYIEEQLQRVQARR